MKINYSTLKADSTRRRHFSIELMKKAIDAYCMYTVAKLMPSDNSTSIVAFERVFVHWTESFVKFVCAVSSLRKKIRRFTIVYSVQAPHYDFTNVVVFQALYNNIRYTSKYRKPRIATDILKCVMKFVIPLLGFTK